MRGYEADFGGDDEDFGFLLDFDGEDAACFAATQHLGGKDARGPKFLRKRAGWEEGLKMLRAAGQFRSRCHMPEPALSKLAEILRGDLPVDELQPRRSSGGSKPISAEAIAGMGLRLMGGELIKSTYWHCGMPEASAHRWAGRFLGAINPSGCFGIAPPPAAECEELAHEWSKLPGALGSFWGCAGAAGGWLRATEKPAAQAEAGYFSGHYQRYGLNIQAARGAHLRFLYFGVIGPGRMSGNRAFSRCAQLRKWLDGLPDGCFLAGGSACAATRKMLTPLSGKAKAVGLSRAYNFYLS
mgnify:CR=1 FL=1